MALAYSGKCFRSFSVVSAMVRIYRCLWWIIFHSRGESAHFFLSKGHFSNSFSSRQAKLYDLFYRFGLVFLVILVPFLVSIAIYTNYQEKGEIKNDVIIQPNIDPYTQKFQEYVAYMHFSEMLRMTLNEATPETDFIIWLETALTFPVWLSSMHSNEAIKKLKQDEVLLDVQIQAYLALSRNAVK